MKKILISLAVVGVVSAIVIGGTVAYFSDTETSEGNTFTAGTIDIAIGDSENSWIDNYDIGDLKPGETGYITFDIKNVGKNPVNVFKRLYSFTHTDSGENYDCGTMGKVSSEPECVAEAGGRIDDVATQIIYDLSVKVYASGNPNPIWWQTIYRKSDGKSLTDVYDQTTNNYVALGMIPFGGHMMVTQSYHFSSGAGNAYQGDGLSFNMEIKGEQLPKGDEGKATVTLVQKEENDGEWHIKDGGASGVLTYKTKSPEFEYNFSANGLTPNTNYELIYYADPWDGSGGSMTIADSLLSNGTGGITTGDQSVELLSDLPVSADANSPQGAKIWLVLDSDFDGTKMVAWNPASYLLETALIQYDDTDN